MRSAARIYRAQALLHRPFWSPAVFGAVASFHATSSAASSHAALADETHTRRWAMKLMGAVAGGAAAAAAVAGGTTVVHQESSEAGETSEGSEHRSLMSDASRAVTFFKYEKRLRDHSNVDKIFDYFSSEADGKHKYMTEADLMQSVVPVFPVGGVRTGYLDGETKSGVRKSLTRLGSTIDTDGNGLISFEEYVFFLQLMSISIEDLTIGLQMLDVDGSKTLSKQEMMAAVGSWNDKAQSTDCTRTGLKGSSPGGAFLPMLFGSDGTKQVPLEKVHEFLAELHEDLAALEFDHYDIKGSGFISGELFAYSAISAMPIPEVDFYLKRLKELPEELKTSQISKDEFKAFFGLTSQSDTFRRASEYWLRRQPEMTLDDFTRAIHGPCGINLSQAQLEILFRLFQPYSKNSPPFPSSFLSMLNLRSLNVCAQSALWNPAASISSKAKSWLGH